MPRSQPPSQDDESPIPPRLPQRRSVVMQQKNLLDLERERNLIEQQMHRLEKQKSKRLLDMQRERIKMLEHTSSVPTLPTVISAENSSSGHSMGHHSESSSECTSSQRCSQCSRKDRIIHRQLREIESLRQQLRDLETKTVPVELLFEDENESVISGVTDR
jgi:hypothetical protein